MYNVENHMLMGFKRATDVMISGKTALVCGFGDVGKGSAQSLRNAGAIVGLQKRSHMCIKAAMEGFKVVTVESVYLMLIFLSLLRKCSCNYMLIKWKK